MAKGIHSKRRKRNQSIKRKILDESKNIYSQIKRAMDARITGNIKKTPQTYFRFRRRFTDSNEEKRIQISQRPSSNNSPG